MTREEKLVRELIAVRTLLQGYGDLHMAKSPPQREKAQTNYNAVTSINNALFSEDDAAPPVQSISTSSQMRRG